MVVGDVTLGFLYTLESLAPIGDATIGQHIMAWKKRDRQGVHPFVAVTQFNEVIGTASLVVEQKHIHDCGKVGRIEDVAVHKAHQAKGIGKALLQACIDKARKLGCYKVILNCNAALVPYYQQSAFVTNGYEMRLDLQ